MKTKPILMSGPLVRAILAGNKTQTRRPIKHLPVNIQLFHQTSERGWMYLCEDGSKNEIVCPYGAVGDQLWVKETWKWEGETSWQDIDPMGLFFYRADPDSEDIRNWKPSIFMPKEASRITLEIEEIRVERLHDISEEDAKAEGVELHFHAATYRHAFKLKWIEIYGEDNHYSNPWVWVIKFKVIKPQS